MENINKKEGKINNDNNLNKDSYKNLLNQIPEKWRDQPVEILRDMWADKDSIPVPIDEEKQKERIEELKRRNEIIDKLENYKNKYDSHSASENINNKETIEKNINIIDNFGYLLSLNAVHLGQYAINEEGRKEIDKMLAQFNSKSINGMSFTEFLSESSKKDPMFLKKESTNSQLINYIRQYIPYIEARIKFLKPESGFVKRFEKIKSAL